MNALSGMIAPVPSFRGLALSTDRTAVLLKKENRAICENNLRVITPPFTDSDILMAMCGSPVIPQYTTSLDAAITLVPPGWGIDIYRSPPEHGASQGVHLLRGKPPFFDDETIEVYAATDILALCSAALRAIEKDQVKTA